MHAYFKCDMVELWTGKQVVNVILCPNKKNKVMVNVSIKERNYLGKYEHMCPKDGWYASRLKWVLTTALG